MAFPEKTWMAGTWSGHDGSIMLKLSLRGYSRHLQHKIGEPVGSIEPAQRSCRRGHAGKALRCHGEVCDLGREPLRRESFLQ
jgi:hypothetical protein